jgi:putative hemolysin
LIAAAIVVLLVLVTVYSYIDRVYTERGKFLDREFQNNIEAFERLIEPQLPMSRDRAALAAALWVELSLAGIGVLTATMVLQRASVTWADWLQPAIFLVLVVVVCNRLVPYLLFTRTRGRWPARWLPLLRATMALMWPVSMLLGFAMSLASLTQPPPIADPEQKRESEIEALVEAGAEEGIIEEHERELVQSALEFGDKRVREIMVPRPEIVALPETATLQDLRELVRERHIGRIPIYRGDTDHILGFVSAHDLLQLSEEQLKSNTVVSLVRPVMFVPESKSTSDLLREMRQQGAPMVIAVNEYGGVAGLVTMADLVEEIVGEIPESAEGGEPDWMQEAPDCWRMAGTLELDRAAELLNQNLESRGATTVAGYVGEHVGRIPQQGEKVVVGDFEYEILEANNVRVASLRVCRIRKRAPAGGHGDGDGSGLLWPPNGLGSSADPAKEQPAPARSSTTQAGPAAKPGERPLKKAGIGNVHPWTGSLGRFASSIIGWGGKEAPAAEGAGFPIGEPARRQGKYDSPARTELG